MVGVGGCNQRNPAQSNEIPAQPREREGWKEGKSPWCRDYGARYLFDVLQGVRCDREVHGARSPFPLLRLKRGRTEIRSESHSSNLFFLVSGNARQHKNGRPWCQEAGCLGSKTVLPGNKAVSVQCLHPPDSSFRIWKMGGGQASLSRRSLSGPEFKSRAGLLGDVYLKPSLRIRLYTEVCL